MALRPAGSSSITASPAGGKKSSGGGHQGLLASRRRCLPQSAGVVHSMELPGKSRFSATQPAFQIPLLCRRQAVLEELLLHLAADPRKVREQSRRTSYVGGHRNELLGGIHPERPVRENYR